jgi:CubicO group peptidase (beta-lactamase class C family)
LFDPLGMRDCGFHVPAADLDRLVTRYRHGTDVLEMVDAPTGQWSSAPPFASGAGGLVGTVDDRLRFARMLLSGGEMGGRRVLDRRRSGAPVALPGPLRVAGRHRDRGPSDPGHP